MLNIFGVIILNTVVKSLIRKNTFYDVFCFHVLEHTDNRAQGLSEMIRVAHRLVELEVPHILGRRAKSEAWKKGDISLYHLCSFKCMWFHRALKNYIYCLKLLYTFPRDIEIHVWIYLSETRRRMKKKDW